MLSIKSMTKWKKRFVIILLLFILLLSVVLYNPIRTIMSIKKVDGLYTMTYYGNYDWLIEILDIYNYKNPQRMYSYEKNECSLFTAFGNSEHPIFGRNDDNTDVPVLVTKCNPSDGYASIAVARINTLGFKKDLSPSLPSLKRRMLFLASPYVSFDGMNEKGVTLASASVESQKVKIDNSKSKITGGHLNREILDHAKNIEEAISIIKKYNLVNPDGNLYGHTLIGDSSGKSIIVECYYGNVEIIPNKESWQVATNTPVYTYYMTNSINEVPCDRYQTAYKELKQASSNIDWEKGMKILKDVSVGNTFIQGKSFSTQWSTIYDMKNGDVYLALYHNYDNVFKFNVKEKKFKDIIISNNH